MAQNNISNDILQNINNDINELKAYTKWLYKYGGTGGKGGSGSGDGSGTSKWSIGVYFNNNPLTNKGSNILNIESQNILRIEINRPGKLEYAPTITIPELGTSVYPSERNRLTESNGWSYEIKYTGERLRSVNKNLSLNISIKEYELNETKTFNSKIVLFPLKYNGFFAYSANNKYYPYSENIYYKGGNNNIYNNGLYVNFDYEINESNNKTYLLKMASVDGTNFIDYSTQEPFIFQSKIIDTSTGNAQGNIIVPIINPNTTIDEEQFEYGEYYINLEFGETIDNTTFYSSPISISLSCYILPDSLFLKFYTNNNLSKEQIYNFRNITGQNIIDFTNECNAYDENYGKTESTFPGFNEYVFNTGQINFDYIGYAGISNLFMTFDLELNVAKYELDINDNPILTSNRQYYELNKVERRIYSKQVLFTTSGIYKITTKLINRNDSSFVEQEYIIYVHEIQQTTLGFWEKIYKNKNNSDSNDLTGKLYDYLYYENIKGLANMFTNNASLSVPNYEFNDMGDVSHILNTINSDKSYIHIAEGKPSISIENDETVSMIFSFGIQYNIVNNTNAKLFSIEVGNNASKSIDIYQNKVEYNYVVNNQRVNLNANIYIKKEEEYDYTDNSKYHLLTLYLKRYPGTSSIDFIIYYDGVMEGTLSTETPLSISDTPLYDKFTFNPDNQNRSNYAINFIDIAYVPNCIISGNNKSYPVLFDDFDILYYYYNYCAQFGIKNKFIFSEDKVINTDYLQYLSNINKIFNENEYEISRDNNVKRYVNMISYEYTTSISSALELEIASQDDKSNVIKNLPKYVGIPILYLVHDCGQEPDIFTGWYSNPYGETNAPKNITPTISKMYWAKSDDDEFTQVRIPSGIQFQIELQGSSTLGYKAKNFELVLVNNTHDASTYIFTPNFNGNASNNDIKLNSFLPESSFTLKADVVDSAHANNTSIGLFVNKNTIKFDTKDISASGKVNYAEYRKNCLMGFPCLLFIDVINSVNSDGEQQNNKLYFLGEYNFNLGRKSFFNLGYYDINEELNKAELVGGTNYDESSTNKRLIDNTTGEFGIYKIDNFINLKQNLIVAEIQGGQKWFDFSQYDSSVLFGVSEGDVEGTLKMFDDFEGTVVNMKERIQTFVKGVARSGYVLFNHIGKNFNDNPNNLYGYDQGYNASLESDPRESINQVPNALYQFTIERNGNNDSFIPPTNPIPYDNNTWSQELDSLIRTIQDPDSGSITEIAPLLDYRSVVEYYTICMIFGLVDSVMKNLNIKSWNAVRDSNNIDKALFYIAFYDMDTALGKDNEGKYVENFAFSDYWLSKKNNTTGMIDETIVYRDFYPKTNNDSLKIPTGYDVPSSYLFAIAKYMCAYKSYENLISLIGNDNLQTISPDVYYAYLRGSGQPLENAKSFMDNYYATGLDNIPEVFITLNYRQKYITRNININNSLQKTISLNTVNSNKFQGRSINKVYDWLNTRLHILDLYFGLNTTNYSIQKYDKNSQSWINQPAISYWWCSTKLAESLPNIVSNINSNSDVLVNKDIRIFTDTASKPMYIEGEGIQDDHASYQVRLRALNLSPLSIKLPQELRNYLLYQSTETYGVTIPSTTGNVYMRLGGSPFWTYSSSSDFLFNRSNEGITFRCYAPYLEEINCSRLVECSVWKLHTPSLKTLILRNNANTDDNNSYYTGGITIDSSFYNISKIVFERVDVELTLTECGCTEVSMTNVRNRKNENDDDFILSISKCKNITNFNITQCKYAKISVDGVNQKDVTINNNAIKEIDITSYYPDSTLNISNDSDLETLKIRGLFSTINISNCERLSNIVIDQNSLSNIKSISIKGCNIYVFKSGDIQNWNVDSEPIHLGFIDAGGNNVFSSLPDTLDLTIFENLESFNFSGTYGFKYIQLIENKTYTLLEDGLSNTDFNLFIYNNETNSDIIPTNKSKIILTNNGQFRNTNILSANINKIIFDLNPLLMNLDSMFMYSIRATDRIKNPNIDVSFVEYFYSNIINKWNNIRSIRQLFYGQSKIIDVNEDTFNKLQALHNKISLGRFTKCSDVRQVYGATGIRILSRSLFRYKDSTNNWSSLGQDNSIETIYIDEMISPNMTSKITTCALYDIVDKIENFFYSNDDTTEQFEIVIFPTEVDAENNEKYKGVTSDYYEVNQLFNINDSHIWPAKLKRLTRISFKHVCSENNIQSYTSSNSKILSYRNLFSNNDTNNTILEQVLTCFNSSNSTISDINSCNLSKCSKLNTIRQSFNLSESNFKLPGDTQSYYTYITQINNDAASYKLEAINYGTFIPWSQLFNSNTEGNRLQIYKVGSGSAKINVTSFSCISDQIIKYIYQTDFESVLGNISASSDTIDYLFSNTIFIDDSTNTLVNNVDIKNTFRCSQIPSNITLGSGRSNMLNIKSAKHAFNNIYSLYVNESPNENEIKGIKLTSVSFYNMDLTDVQGMFEGNEIYGEIPMNVFNKAYEENNIIKYVQNIENISRCFANITITSSKQTFMNNTCIYNTLSLDKFGETFDIDTNDNILGIRTNYIYLPAGSQEDAQLIFRNYSINTNNINTNDNKQYTGLLLPPDILYGCNITLAIFTADECFADSNFVGVLPKHLFNTDALQEYVSLSIDIAKIKIRSIFKNLKVLPRYYTTLHKEFTRIEHSVSKTYAELEDAYVFVPQRFIKLSNHLIRTFDFSLLLPDVIQPAIYLSNIKNNGLHSYNGYYFLYDNSIDMSGSGSGYFISNIFPVQNSNSNMNIAAYNSEAWFNSIIHLGICIDSVIDNSNSEYRQGEDINVIQIQSSISNIPIISNNVFYRNSYDGLDMKLFTSKKIQLGQIVNTLLAGILFGNIIKIYQGDLTDQFVINKYIAIDTEVNNKYLYFDTYINTSEGITYPIISVGSSSLNNSSWLSRYLNIPFIDNNLGGGQYEYRNITPVGHEKTNDKYFIKYELPNNATKTIKSYQISNTHLIIDDQTNYSDNFSQFKVKTEAGQITYERVVYIDVTSGDIIDRLNAVTV